jgi:hypothetical protein
VLAGMLLGWQIGAPLQQSWQQLTLVMQLSKKVTAAFASHFAQLLLTPAWLSCHLKLLLREPFSSRVRSMLVAVTAGCCMCCSALGKARVQTRVHGL